MRLGRNAVALSQAGQSHHVVRQRQSRIERERPLQDVLRVIHAVLPQVHVAQVGKRIAVVLPQGHGFLERLRRLRQVPLCSRRGRKLLERGHERGVAPQRFAAPPDGGVTIAAHRVRAPKLVIELRPCGPVLLDRLFEPGMPAARFEPCCTWASARYSSFSGVGGSVGG